MPPKTIHNGAMQCHKATCCVCAQGETCGVFSVSVLNGDTPSTDAMPPVPPQQLRLRDICQQNITLVDEHGQPIYDLASQAPACL